MSAIFLGAFLVAHGLLHASYFTPKPNDPNYPFDFEKGWFSGIAGPAATSIGTILTVIVILSFLLAALSVVGIPFVAEYGRVLVTIGAVTSILLLGLFWHPWLILGIVINAVLLYGTYGLGWRFGG